MTRFIGEAVGQRSGRSKGTNLRKEMEGEQRHAVSLRRCNHQADWPGCLQTFRKLADMPNLCKLLLQNGFLPCLKET